MMIAELCGLADPAADLWLPPEVYAELAPQIRRLRPPPRLPAPALVTPVPVDPTGAEGPTRGQSRGRAWRRTAPNRFVPADAEVTQPAQRIREAADLLPDGGCVTGWAALHLAGARWFDGSTTTGAPLPVLLALGPRGQRVDREGVAVHRQQFGPEDVTCHHGVACLTPERALLDEMRRTTSARDAAVALEMACFAELTSLARFTAILPAHHHRPGIGLVWEATSLAVEGTQSPPEARMHLTWELDAGFPRPLCNPEVFSLDGRFLGRPDLLDPEAGVVGEYDGDHHLAARQRSRDLGREERFRAHGLGYFTVVGGELGQGDAVVDRMAATRARALRSAEPRRWTLQAPPGWRSPLTLDERLALREQLLARSIPRM